jgi:hypothetical protein
MENQKLCPVCNSNMLYNSIGLSKNPKAPTYKCSNESCKMYFNIQTKTWEPSQFRTGVWEKAQPVAQPMYQAPKPTPKPQPEQPNWDRISLGKCKYGFLIEAFKLGKPLAEAEKEAEAWAKASMRLLPEANDIGLTQPPF